MNDPLHPPSHAPRGILVFGPNGSGKTTLAREVARLLHAHHMDHETYHFAESAMPYTVVRPRAECLRRMREDMLRHGTFVLSAVTGDFDDPIPRWYALAIYLSAPKDLRLRRIEQREVARHGDRVRAGGDMAEQHRAFLEFAATRSLDRIDRWAGTLACPVVRVDGTGDVCATAADIAARFGAMR